MRISINLKFSQLLTDFEFFLYKYLKNITKSLIFSLKKL